MTRQQNNRRPDSTARSRDEGRIKWRRDHRGGYDQQNVRSCRRWQRWCVAPDP